MQTIVSLNRKIQQLNIDKVINHAVENTLPDLIEINKDQLLHGMDKNGEKITPKYKRNKYARVKNEMNPLAGIGTPDLKVKGDYYKGLTAKLEGGTIVETSTDFKAEFLEPKYDDIHGLGGEYKKRYQDKNLRPAIGTEIEKTIGLKFGS